jgi:hypothetical protein
MHWLWGLYQGMQKVGDDAGSARGNISSSSGQKRADDVNSKTKGQNLS